MRFFPARYESIFLPFVLVVWIGLQLEGYYWLLLVLTLLSLVRERDSLRFFFSCKRNLLLSAFLLIFSLSLLTAAALDSGLQGLLSEIPVSLPILPMFIYPSIALGQRKSLFSPRLQSVFYAIAVAFLSVIVALWHWTHLVDSPASSIRPLELQASSGVFFLTAINTYCLFQNPIGDQKRLYPAFLTIVTAVLSLISFSCFRGITSGSVFLLNIVSVFSLYVLPGIRRYNLFLIGLSIAFSALALTPILDFRFFFLKLLVNPIFSNDIANGRVALLNRWLSEYGEEPPLLVGAQSSVPADFFAHNVIFDSIIKDGTLAASSIFLFALVLSFFLLRNLFQRHDMRSFLNALQFFLMAIPALLQPVQFSHAFAFLLSISTFGILASGHIAALPDSPSPQLRL